MMDKLLQLLSTNSQFTTGEIAAMLGEPEDYIKAQIKEYENQGIIKGYQAVVNWEGIEDSFVEALIELKVTPKKETGFDEMAKMCMAFEEVESVYLMACRTSACLSRRSSPRSTELSPQALTSSCAATRTEA